MPKVRGDHTLVTVETVAQRFGVSASTVRAWVRSGRIPVIRPSRRVIRFRIDDVERAVTRELATSARGDRR